MVKLLLCLLCGLIIAAAALQLRQQRLELSCEMNQLHNEIEAQQAKLWRQQLNIAISTAPNALSQTMNTSDLNMVPQSPLPRASHWLESPFNPDAE